MQVVQAAIQMGVLVTTGDMTAVRRTAQFFLNRYLPASYLSTLILLKVKLNVETAKIKPIVGSIKLLISSSFIVTPEIVG